MSELDSLINQFSETLTLVLGGQSTAGTSANLDLRVSTAGTPATLDLRDSTAGTPANLDLREISTVGTNIIVNTNSQESIMTTQTVNYTLLKMYLDTIHPYEGNPNTLNSFISACDFVFETYCTNNDAILKSFLIRTVRMKLIDRAQTLVGSRLELTNWDQLKFALSDCFGDKRNIECLEQDLLFATPFKNESSLDFGKRLQVYRSNLAQKINSQTDMDQNTKLIYLRQYEQICLRTFIRGLTGSLQSIIRLKNPVNLETALTYVNEEENFHYSQNLFKNPAPPKTCPQNNLPNLNKNFKMQTAQNFNYQNNNQNQNFINRPMQQPMQYVQQPMQYMQQPIQYNRFPQNNQNRFPSQPINMQPRQINQKYFTNRQVFGPPKNVFKPNGQVNANKPEPMSIRSSYTMPHNRNQPQGSNYFKPTGPRNFISEELFQIDENNVITEGETPNTVENPNSYNQDVPLDSGNIAAGYNFESGNEIPNFENAYYLENQNFIDTPNFDETQIFNEQECSTENFPNLGLTRTGT